MGGRMKMRMKNWVLLNWHWSVSSANNEGFGHSQLRAHLFFPDFATETVIKHLQPYLPCLIIDLEMVSREFFGLIDLLGAYTLCIHETTEVVVICKNENFILAAFQIVTPCFEGFDNSQKLAIVGLVSSLCRNHFSQKKHYRVLIAQIGLSNYPIKVSSESQLT